MQPTSDPPEGSDPPSIFTPKPLQAQPVEAGEAQYPFKPIDPEAKPTSPFQDTPPTPQPAGIAPPSVLVVHPDSGTLRIARESLTSFRFCQVETTPDAEYGFELALKKRYHLFIFGLAIPVLHGELLYSLISRAYTFSHEGALTAPAVVYIGDAKDANRSAELKQDARVKGVVFRPFKIDRFLAALGESLPEIR